MYIRRRPSKKISPHQINKSHIRSITQHYLNISMAEEREAREKAYAAPPQINPYGRVDEEVADVAARDERRRKRIKCFAYLAAFVVLQTAVFLIFGLTIMKVRTPKLRLRSAAFDGAFDVVSTAESPSFNVRMVAEIGLRNANFGRYKYQNGTVEFYYGGTKVGEAFIPRANAKARSTRKFNVTVDLSSAGVPAGELSSQIGSVIPLTSRSAVRGKVEIMKIMKKNKSSNMNCTMQIDVPSRQLREISCR